MFYVLGVPGPPTLLEAKDVTATSAGLAWKAPEDNGGSPITNYMIEKRQGESSRWAKVNRERVTDCEYDVTGLIEGSEYHFRVSAENTAGMSPASQPIGPVIPKAPETPIKFILPLQDQEAKVDDEEVTLVCEVNKDDTEAMWYKDGNLLQTTDRYKPSTRGRKHILTISNVKLEDEAQFSCQVPTSSVSESLCLSAKGLWYIHLLFTLVTGERCEHTVCLVCGRRSD